MNAVGALWCAI